MARSTARHPSWLLCLIASSLFTPARSYAADKAPDPELYYFSRATPGPFVAGQLAAGLSASSLVILGWGRPHWLWGGAYVRTSLTPSFSSQAAGLRLGTPLGEFDLQARRVAAYEHRFLGPAAKYNAAALTSGEGGIAAYNVAEASTTLYLPAVIGFFYLCAWVDYASQVPRGAYFLDEVTRAVVKGPWLGSEQLGFLVYLDTAAHHRLGPIVEHVWSQRNGSPLIRVGLAYSALFTAHLGLLAMVTEPVASPDALGAFSGAGGNVLLSYAWSSTDPGEAR